MFRNTPTNYDRLLTTNSRYCLRLIQVRLQIETNKIHPFIQSSQATLCMYRDSKVETPTPLWLAPLWSFFIKVPFTVLMLPPGFIVGRQRDSKNCTGNPSLQNSSAWSSFLYHSIFSYKTKSSQISIREILRGRERERGGDLKNPLCEDILHLSSPSVSWYCSHGDLFNKRSLESYNFVPSKMYLQKWSWCPCTQFKYDIENNSLCQQLSFNFLCFVDRASLYNLANKSN